MMNLSICIIFFLRMLPRFPKRPLVSLCKFWQNLACPYTPNQKQQSHIPFLGGYLHAVQEIDALLPETLMNRESCNLIGQEHFGL